MAELHDVAVAHEVVLALDAGLAGGAGRRHRAGRHQVIERHDLRLDEAALEVAMDYAGRLWGGRADRDLPGARLLRPGRQEGLQPKRPEPGRCQLRKTRLAHSRLG